MANPEKFTSKPVTIEAMRIPVQQENEAEKDYEERLREVAKWVSESDVYIGYDRQGHMTIETLEGNMLGNPGDWIIKGTRGEFYPCKPDVFATKYRKAD